MSSSIFSSEAHRRFTLALLLGPAVPAYALIAIGLYLGTPYGDLTRMGFYAEREFGWTRPQLKFDQPLYDIHHYEAYRDIVIIGDSFSMWRPDQTWPNYLVARTGSSLVALMADVISIDELVAKPVFREAPPKLVIYQAVERDVPSRVEANGKCEDPAQAPTRSPRVSLSAASSRASATGVEPQPFERGISLAALDIRYVFRYLRTNLLRRLGGTPESETTKLALARPAPFSSANASDLLVYYRDMEKIERWRETDVAALACRIEAMQRAVERNGRTRFVFMIAPDKLTAYADFLESSRLKGASRIAELTARVPGVIPHLETALLSAIRRGEQDVYLPDDTHWGASGQKIVADVLIDFLGTL